MAAVQRRRRGGGRQPQGGHVYVMTNAAMPGLVKIGMTGRDPRLRVRELSQVSGVPTPFRLHYAVEVTDRGKVERRVHRLLARHRVNRRREFFRLEPGEAQRLVAGAVEGHYRRDLTLFRLGLRLALGALLILGLREASGRVELPPWAHQDMLVTYLVPVLAVWLMALAPPWPAWRRLSP
ncbi:GIY-YIG nuclease family protein [Marinimicrococcus flavescens]|uniref:GIY-YIG nuclease family protein n=1 Tax=Marinimicrococcus flavescens TaxID=3031815 RepID=A0AAP3XSI0_9PROT|nr:GIY-YIG nuclease family protein [Marinimicrococcus flavescens]